MKTLVFILGLLFLPVLNSSATAQYLGNYTANPYGRYGSPYSSDSINNPYGPYGSPYSPQSPNNPYGTGMGVYR